MQVSCHPQHPQHRMSPGNGTRGGVSDGGSPHLIANDGNQLPAVAKSHRVRVRVRLCI